MSQVLFHEITSYLFSLKLSQQIVLHLILVVFIAYMGDYCMQTKPVAQIYGMTLL